MLSVHGKLHQSKRSMSCWADLAQEMRDYPPLDLLYLISAVSLTSQTDPFIGISRRLEKHQDQSAVADHSILDPQKIG